MSKKLGTRGRLRPNQTEEESMLDSFLMLRENRAKGANIKFFLIKVIFEREGIVTQLPYE